MDNARVWGLSNWVVSFTERENVALNKMGTGRLHGTQDTLPS